MVLSRSLTASVLLALALPAWAQDVQIPDHTPYPFDIEIARPGASPDRLFAMDSPRDGRRNTFALSTYYQYERSPLRVFVYDNLVGRVISNRNVLHLGGMWSATNRVAIGASIPLAVHSGGDLGNLDNNGFGVGDVDLWLRWKTGEWGPLTLGLQGTLLLPTGAQLRYMGDKSVRGRVGALGALKAGRFDLYGNLFFDLRAPVQTAFDFTAGSELEPDVGLRYHLVRGLDLQAEWLNRIGITLGKSGGRWSSEAIGGVRYEPSKPVRLTLGVGRGITAGYGTTGFRVIAGFQWVHIPPPPPPPVEPPPKPTVIALPEKPEPKPAPKPAAPPARVRIVGDQILLQDEIHFAVNTAKLLADSTPVLQDVANLLNSEPRIAHVVIEGHASQEGSFEYNMKLSDERAEAIFRALVLAGVHPARLSYRGMGEVNNEVPGTDEASLAKNRRVQFHIIKTYGPGETLPKLDPHIKLPWNGQPYTVKVPTLPGNKVPLGPIKPDDTVSPPAPAPTTPAPAPDPEPNP